MGGQLPGSGALKAHCGKHSTKHLVPNILLIPDVAELDLKPGLPLSYTRVYWPTAAILPYSAPSVD